MSEQRETKPGSCEHLTPPQDQLSFKQIAKLDLELASLRRKIKNIETYSPIFPLVGSFITLIALGLGFWQFQSQQKLLQEKTLNEQRDGRANRLQDQLRGDVDKILGFQQDKNQTMSTLSFLLHDMNLLLSDGQGIRSGEKTVDDQTTKFFKDSRRTVTEALVEQIVNDADFEKSPRDIIFATKIVVNWPDYKEYLKEAKNFDNLRKILAKYLNAMSSFRKSNPLYIDKVQYNEFSKLYGPPPDYDSNLFLTLSYICVGFKQHLDLLPGGPEAKKVFLSRFVYALCNPGLAEQTLGDDVKLVARCKSP